MVGGDVCPAGRGSLVSFDAPVLSFCLGGPLGGRSWDIFATDLWFGGSTRGACNETGQMGQRFCDVSTWLYVSFFLNLGRFARIGWGELF